MSNVSVVFFLFPYVFFFLFSLSLSLSLSFQNYFCHRYPLCSMYSLIRSKCLVSPHPSHSNDFVQQECFAVLFSPFLSPLSLFHEFSADSSLRSKSFIYFSFYFFFIFFLPIVKHQLLTKSLRLFERILGLKRTRFNTSAN